MADLDEARRAKDELKRTLAGRPEVTGIGIAPDAGGYGVLVRVREPDPAGGVRPHLADVPTSVRGVSVHVRTSGPVTAQG